MSDTVKKVFNENKEKAYYISILNMMFGLTQQEEKIYMNMSLPNLESEYEKIWQSWADEQYAVKKNENFKNEVIKTNEV
ncbi:hypothetical protein RM616_09405 [Mammaliicoccus sciuri]|uniref:hypothetical protein n=1 Tax=Mammaliicoccus sciuri TaxID=1296 RepID=UPI0028874514|nr:hypothetical protein [Mammaliicoccus sciuri]MDT0669791.1 hypothetical protein [Mammaliicoccus sciuri]